MFHGWQGYLGMRRILAGLDQIACGLVFFAVAAVISFKKAGIESRWIESRLGNLAEASGDSSLVESR